MTREQAARRIRELAHRIYEKLQEQERHSGVAQNNDDREGKK